jgi:hypothetical protein
MDGWGCCRNNAERMNEKNEDRRDGRDGMRTGKGREGTEDRHQLRIKAIHPAAKLAMSSFCVANGGREVLKLK